MGNQTLSTNVYSDTADKLLDRVEYGNGGRVNYTYDGFKRTTGIHYDGAAEPRFTYAYGANGATAEVKDAELNRAAKLDYDFAERPVQAELWEGGDLAYHLAQGYDEFNQPGELTENVRESATSRTLHKTRCQYDIEGRPTTLEYESRAIAQIANAAEGPVTYPDTPAKQVIYKEGTATDDVHAQVSAPGYVPNAATPKRYVGYTYDKLGRIGARRVGADTKSRMLMETSYGFLKGAATENTTGLVERISQLGSSTYYRYDNVGNIIQETRGFSPIPFADMQGTVTSGTPDSTQPANHPARDQQGNLQLTGGLTYEYDKLGQLTRVNDEYAGETWTYEYDQGGNILKKTCQGYTTQPLQGVLGVYTYTYGNPGWKDQLTAYDGKAITYDAIGNPLTYDGWAYTWKAGRMLHNMTNGSINATFTYDHTGLRVKKSVNGVDTLYTLNGKKITHVRKQVNGENTVRMHFFYDAQGRPSIIRYNDVDYVYVHNLQGDVIAIVDMDGNKVVEYGYDAWGRPTGKTGALAGTLGTDNPFRYRGYVWDEETGLYYLRSRYYDPCWGRFLNADVIATQRGTLFAHNQYCYCRNNAIGNKDSDGLYWETAMDLTSLYYSAEDYYKDPSLENYGWYLLDLVCVALPIASGPGAARRAGKLIDGAMDVVDLASKVDDVGDAAKMAGKSDEVVEATIKRVKELDAKGTLVTANEALDLASDYLGKGYQMAEPGRYVSDDALRQVRLKDCDILHRTRPHFNFELRENLIIRKWKYNFHILLK